MKKGAEAPFKFLQGIIYNYSTITRFVYTPLFVVTETKYSPWFIPDTLSEAATPLTVTD